AVVLVLPELALDTDSVDRADPVAVRDRVSRLLDEPEVHRESPRCGRRDEHELRAVEAEHARTLREVPVVADVHADLADRGVEHRVAHVARTEVELLPEAGQMRDVR